jgi:hypothetical protein
MEQSGNGTKLQNFLNSLNNYIQKNQFPQLDPTTPWFEYNSYVECCNSLGRPVRLGGFMRYQAYLKEIGVI